MSVTAELGSVEQGWSRTETLARATTSLWPLWFAVGSSLAAAFGVHWDIAWHRSIGRDSFWTPPHVAIYSAAVMAAVAALARIIPATFGRGAGGDSVRVLGFRGPLGAFISAWGGGTMLASAPFDDWWHNAYGLDVKILSPPHVALAVGLIALHVGALVMLAGAVNASEGSRRRTLEALLIVVGGNMVVGLMTLFMEKTVRPFMHLGSFYFIVGLIVPLLLAAVQGATGRRWAGSWTALFYSLFLLALLWTFPLVPAQPKLGPVLVPVTSLVPPEFPLLLLPAALALDAWAWRSRDRRGLAVVAIGGLLFTAVFLACQWPFASFLMSPRARNFFWGARYFDFWMPPTTHYRRYAFLSESGAATAIWLAVAFAGTSLSLAAGRGFGRWLSRLRR
ncbi:MAG TPA: hypothetical protein VMT03_12985 [Polyangia bacterium]|nr:hypothetical protein [Polyangia bacterium]